MSDWMIAGALGAAVLAGSAPARAEDEPPPPAGEPSKRARDRSVSLTISPLHLLSPIVEIDAELAVGDHVGIAVLGGIGSIRVDDSLGEKHRFAAYEVGGRFIGYPIAAFESLQLGAELLWIHVSTDDYDGDIEGTASGVAAGPFIGYKLITDGGFTFFAEGGVEYAFVRAEATNGQDTETDEESRWIPLLNLNLGWSF